MNFKLNPKNHKKIETNQEETNDSNKKYQTKKKN